jgi:hypothetical protein
MRIGRGNQSTRRKPTPVPLCPPQIPYDLRSNQDCRGRKPAINPLSYGTASTISETSHIKSTLKRLIAQEALIDYDLFKSWSIHLFKRWLVRISARTQDIRISLSLQYNTFISSHPLPSKSFPIHHSTLYILATDNDVTWAPPPQQKKKRDIEGNYVTRPPISLGM